MAIHDPSQWPQVRPAGFDGFLVSFADRLSEPANRAALAFRDAVEGKAVDGVQECSTSLASAYVRYDPLDVAPQTMRAALADLVASRDWYAAPLSGERRFWRIPTAFGGTLGPQLAEAAALAGLSEKEAIASIAETVLRVQTIGFAPGMPYLGELAESWNIPRQTELTARVPRGGLCVAIRQLVLFPVDTPTGWRHIGQTHVRLFQPDADQPFLLRPGDEVRFEPVDEDRFAALSKAADGGAVCTVLS